MQHLLSRLWISIALATLTGMYSDRVNAQPNQFESTAAWALSPITQDRLQAKFDASNISPFPTIFADLPIQTAQANFGSKPGFNLNADRSLRTSRPNQRAVATITHKSARIAKSSLPRKIGRFTLAQPKSISALSKFTD